MMKLSLVSPEPYSAADGLARVRIGGLPIIVLDRAQTAQMMCDAARTHSRNDRPLYHASANVEVLAQCFLNPQLVSFFGHADRISADGHLLVAASRFLCRYPLPECVETAELFYAVAERAEAEKLSFYMLGGTDAENALGVENLQQRYPKLEIAGGSPGDLDDRAMSKKIIEINELRPDILWLDMDVLTAQRFMLTHGHALRGVGVIKTADGILEILSGSKEQAPRWMRMAGLEWLWRFEREPRRLLWQTVVANPVAVYLMAHASS